MLQLSKDIKWKHWKSFYRENFEILKVQKLIKFQAFYNFIKI